MMKLHRLPRRNVFLETSGVILVIYMISSVVMIHYSTLTSHKNELIVEGEEKIGYNISNKQFVSIVQHTNTTTEVEGIERSYVKTEVTHTTYLLPDVPKMQSKDNNDNSKETSQNLETAKGSIGMDIHVAGEVHYDDRNIGSEGDKHFVDAVPKLVENDFFREVEQPDIKCDDVIRLGINAEDSWNLCVQEGYIPAQQGLAFSIRSGRVTELAMEHDMATMYNCTLHVYDTSINKNSVQIKENIWLHGIEEERITDVLLQSNNRKTISYLRVDLTSHSSPLFLSAILNRLTLSNVKQIGLDIHLDSASNYTTYVNQLLTIQHTMDRLKDQGFMQWFSELNRGCLTRSPFQDIFISTCIHVGLINKRYHRTKWLDRYDGDKCNKSLLSDHPVDDEWDLCVQGHYDPQPGHFALSITQYSCRRSFLLAFRNLFGCKAISWNPYGNPSKHSECTQVYSIGQENVKLVNNITDWFSVLQDFLLFYNNSKQTVEALEINMAESIWSILPFFLQNQNFQLYTKQLLLLVHIKSTSTDADFELYRNILMEVEKQGFVMWKNVALSHNRRTSNSSGQSIPSYYRLFYVNTNF